MTARRLVINGRFLSQPLTGVQRFARETTQALDRLLDADPGLARRWEVDLAVPPNATLDLPLRRVRVRTVGARLRGQAWEQLALPRAVGPHGTLVSFANTGPVAVARQLVVMHDAAVWAVPATFSRRFRWWYRVLLPSLGRRVAAVGAVSDFGRRELIARAGVPAGKIVRLPPGADHAAGAADAAELARLPLPERPFVLAVGSNVPHKQFATVAAAVARVECEGIELVVVGGPGGPSHASGTGAPVRGGLHVGRVSDGALRSLYERALALVFPSSYEGFGLPPLEAMAAGCPVVVAAAGALPEVCGDAALYCAVGDAAGLAGHIATLARDPSLRAEMIGRGRLRAAQFTWRGTALALLDAVESRVPVAVEAAAGAPAARDAVSHSG